MKHKTAADDLRSEYRFDYSKAERGKYYKRILKAEMVTFLDCAAPLTEAQRAELDRRIAEHEASPDDVVPWEEVKASITKRLKK